MSAAASPDRAGVRGFVAASGRGVAPGPDPIARGDCPDGYARNLILGMPAVIVRRYRWKGEGAWAPLSSRIGKTGIDAVAGGLSNVEVSRRPAVFRRRMDPLTLMARHWRYWSGKRRARGRREVAGTELSMWCGRVRPIHSPIQEGRATVAPVARPRAVCAWHGCARPRFRLSWNR